MSTTKNLLIKESDLGELAIFKDEARWVNWGYKTAAGKATKVPFGSTTDPTTWKKFCYLNITQPVGIVFTPDKLLLGVDIDHCLIPGTTTIDHEQKETIAQFLIEANTYCEISPSGTGLHILLKLSDPLTLTSNRKSPFEAYTQGRYFTVTTNPYKAATPVRTVTSKEAIQLLNIIGYPWAAPITTTTLHSFQQQVSQNQLTDEHVLELMFKSKHGTSIKSLYEGDITQHDNNHSVADLSLLSHLAFWTEGNTSQMERIWIKSPLGSRDKTIRQDYRQRSIVKAIQGCKEFYQRPSTTTSHNSTNYNSSSPIDAKSNDNEILFNRSSDVESKPIEWFWDQKIAKGKVTMIAGDPGLGKSQTTIFLAALASTGGTFPGGALCAQGKVLLFSAEDDVGDTINPRLEACGANKENVYILNTVKIGEKSLFFDLSRDLPLVEKALSSIKDVSLIVIDPITAFMGDTDSHVNAEVRGLLVGLSKVASKYNVAIVVVSHLNKSTGGNALSKITGSLAFVAAARAAYMVLKDKDDEARRLFLPVKNNLADDKGGFAFRVEGTEIGPNKIRTSHVVWENVRIMMTAAEALSESKEERQGVNPEIVAWLEKYLTDRPEGVLAEVLLKDASRQVGASKSTVYRAEKELMISKVQEGKTKRWMLVEINSPPNS